MKKILKREREDLKSLDKMNEEGTKKFETIHLLYHFST